MKQIGILFIFLISFQAFAQKNLTIESVDDSIQKSISFKNPTQAALYSAMLPGLGQYYNKKYWKIPVVWGLIGTGAGFIGYYQNLYSQWRTAYLAELRGEEHEFSQYPQITLERLAKSQDEYRRNRDYAIVLTILAYALNIVDAAVDAHLSPFENDNDLSFQPLLLQNSLTNESQFGFSLSYTFK